MQFHILYPKISVDTDAFFLYDIACNRAQFV